MKKIYISILFVLVFATQSLVAQTFVQWYTSMGNFRAQIREDLVPITGNNFLSLVNIKFYDNLKFHRVVHGFVIQDGDPLGNGTGGSGVSIPLEINPLLRHDAAGALGMARDTNINSAESQYYMTLSAQPSLDDDYAVFGHVFDGLEVVMAIGDVQTDDDDQPIDIVRIDSIRVVTGTASITISAPLGGESIVANTEQRIIWQSEFLPEIVFQYSIDNGTNWFTVDTIPSAPRYYDWLVPDTVSNECKIRLSDPNNPDLAVQSLSAIKIVRLDLLSPNQMNIRWIGGTTHEINWTSQNVDHLNILFSGDNGASFNQLIASDLPALNNSFQWTIPQDSASNRCKIRICDANSQSAGVQSSTKFTIAKLNLLTPALNDTLYGATNQILTWESKYLNSLKLEYRLSESDIWHTIIASTSETSTTWLVPDTTISECQFRLSQSSSPDLCRISQKFQILDSHTGVQSVAQNGFILKVQPNPLSDNSTIYYEIPEGYNKQITIALYDLQGKKVETVFQQKQKAGKFSIPLNSKQLKAGMYFCRLTSTNEVLNVKVLILNK